MALIIRKTLIPRGPGADDGTPLREVIGSVDFDSSYPTNGEAMDLSGDIPDLRGVIFENKAGYSFEYDYANKKVKAYYSDLDATADGPSIEVANTTDLSALTLVQYRAWGF